MADIDIATYEQIITMMTHLLTYYTQLALTYQEMFYDPEPKDITVQLYDAEGNLVDYTIPNRAKDFNFVKNGEGDPNNVVSAEVGTTYQDTLNGKLYIKPAGTASDTEWRLIGSDTSIREGFSNPEGLIEGAKGDLYKDKTHCSLYIKTTETGNTGWVLINANIESLANRDLSNLTFTGNNKFLDRVEGMDLINLREILANKINQITGNSDIKYPTEKAVVDYVSLKTEVLANQDLSNLSSIGQNIINTKAGIDLDNLSDVGEQRLSKLIPYSIQYGNTDSDGNLDLISVDAQFNQTFIYASPGTYVFSVPREGVYEIEAVSAGGGGIHWDHGNTVHTYYAGATGAYFYGTIRLTAGDHVAVVGEGGLANQYANSTGGGATEIDNIFVLSGGSGCKRGEGTGGQLTMSDGVVDTYTYNVGKPPLYRGGGSDDYRGRDGQSSEGVVPDDLVGYGWGSKTGTPWGNGGRAGNGYLKITLLGEGSKEVNYKVSSVNPLVLVNKNGVKEVIYGINNDQLGGLPNGRYNKFVNAQGSDFFRNTIYRGYTRPSLPYTNDVWIKKVFPVEVYIYSGSTWEEYDKIYIGSVDIIGGEISRNPRNAYMSDNGFTSTLWNRQVIKAGKKDGYWYRLYSDGWVEQGGRIPVITNTTSGTIIFPFKFKDTNYTVATNRSNGSYYFILKTDTCTDSTIDWVKQNATVIGDWMACGFASLDELNYRITDQ